MAWRGLQCVFLVVATLQCLWPSQVVYVDALGVTTASHSQHVRAPLQRSGGAVLAGKYSLLGGGSRGNIFARGSNPRSGLLCGTRPRRKKNVLFAGSSGPLHASPLVGIMSSMPSSDPWFIWSILFGASSIGLWSERTQFGAALSSSLVSMLITISLCNMGIIPCSSPVYNTVNKVLVPLSVPLLLFDADIRRVAKYAGTLLKCFVLGTVGTVIGTIAAAFMVPLELGVDGAKIACALAARHIGGAINYVAVAEALSMSPDAVVACLAADNLCVALYFSFLFWRTASEPKEEEPIDIGSPASRLEGAGPARRDPICHAVALSCAVTCMGSFLSRRLQLNWLGPIPMATLLTVAAATLFPRRVGSLGSAGAIVGCILMQLFFAATGAAGSLAIVLQKAPKLLIFSAVQIVVHYGFLTTVGGLMGLPFRELALASNANVGGPTTAAGMAAAKGWKNLVLPALLTGILGYAVATFIGISMAPLLARIMMP